MSRARNISIKKSLLIGLPLLLLLLVSVPVIWLLSSSSGANWLWTQLEDAAAGSVRSTGVEGDMASGFVIHGLKYQTQGLEITIARAQIQARPGFWPLSLQVQELLLQDIAIVSKTSANTESEDGQTDFSSVIESMNVSFPVEVHHVELTHVVFQENDAAPVVLADSLNFKLKLNEQLDIQQLVFSSDTVKATAQGHLRLEPPFELSASLDGRFEIVTANNAQNLSLPIALESSGNLDKLLFTLSSSETGLAMDGQLVNPLTAFEWDISGSLRQLPQAIKVAQEEIALHGITFVSQGKLEDWSLELAGDLEIVDRQTTTLHIISTGSESGIQIHDSTVKGTGVDLGINGKFDWSPQLEAKLHAVIGQLDVSPWLKDWPDAEVLTGELGIEWSAGGLRISSGKFGVSGTDLAINIGADIDLETDSVDARLGWSHLTWPLKTSTPDFNSPSGQLVVSGSLDKWTTAGELEVQMGAYPQGSFKIQGGGDRQSTHIELLDGEILGGHLSGLADVDWKEAVRWDARLLAQGVDPEPVAAGWPGRLDANFGLRADSGTGQLKLSIDSLQGMLRGTRISARGDLELVEEDIRFDQLEIRTDDAILQLDGNVTDIAGVTGHFSGQLPSMLLQGASGNVEMKGRFSNHPGHSMLDMQLQADDLAWSGFDIKSLALTAEQNSATGPIPALDLNISRLVWKDDSIDEISLSLKPDGKHNQLQASLANELFALDASMDLVSENPADFLHSTWNGVLDAMNVEVKQKYHFALTDPSAFVWSGDRLLLESACLRETRGAGLCIGIDNRLTDLSLSADVTALPIDYLRDVFEFDVKFEQLLEGHLEWHQSKGKAPTGGADFRITAGRVIDLVDNEPLMDSNDGVFSFVLQNGNLESGVVDVEFPGVGFIDINFDVLDIVEDGDKQLKGRAAIQLNDIKIIGQLAFPGMDDVDGQFDSDIRLSGTLVDPAFEGGFNLTDGYFYYAPIGLKLEDVSLSGILDSRDRGSLTGQFRAGEGTGMIDGHFIFENVDQMKVDLSISGDQLLLVNTGQLKVLTETQLEIGLSPRRIDINGQIRVPSANLQTTNLVLNTVSDSEDLIVESRGASETVSEGSKTAQTQVFGKLEVSFGKDVHVKVPDIETSISGSVVYNWTGDQVPLAEGAYVLTGKVDVYGPTLQISNGRISFPGVPADNPLLNIRAQREIFGNTQIRSAGVQVIGTLKRPVLEAYTVPVTNEDRAWTLLVTGSDFDQGQGVGGFDVGTYIAPKLYVSYGISLFENNNVVSARYDLKKGFGIKVTSGQRETGVDISYTIDR